MKLNKLTPVNQEEVDLNRENMFKNDEVTFPTPKEAYITVKAAQREVVAKSMKEGFKEGKYIIELPFKIIPEIVSELEEIGWYICGSGTVITWKDWPPTNMEKEITKE